LRDGNRGRVELQPIFARTRESILQVNDHGARLILRLRSRSLGLSHEGTAERNEQESDAANHARPTLRGRWAADEFSARWDSVHSYCLLYTVMMTSEIGNRLVQQNFLKIG
jgi:hypothetical protein